ncbi:hypothetical protein JKI95_07010 [Corynebacterium aquatimens]|uniref:hypothetical protein n=1 Tax=Corynebacterium TaxID=1716 RepID=UPI001F300242|nr:MULTISPECIES: hypothetical protein [Corynebacterium]QYH19038.1 hypothetical protein JKI95_07010 [Corynebacterium aquatimens]UIZ92112.1 hypothetical protein JZY91_10725 [Corynebacterium sp. CNCTC7651]
MFSLEDFERIITGEMRFSWLEGMVKAAYNLNVRMMRYGGTMYGKAHNPYFAHDVFRSAVEWKDRSTVLPKTRGSHYNRVRSR